MKKNILAHVIATWFFSGKSPFAPGTIGSLCTLPLIYLIYPYGINAILFSALVCFIIGWFATRVILKTQENPDPGFVVIDEVVGQTLTFFAMPFLFAFSWKMLIAGFILFRFFDIVKIWPASYFDKHVHSAFGVMMDDVVAGVYAGCVLLIGMMILY